LCGSNLTFRDGNVHLAQQTKRTDIIMENIVKRMSDKENEPKDKYTEVLFKLFLKGMIDEKKLKEKLNERK